MLPRLISLIIAFSVSNLFGQTEVIQASVFPDISTNGDSAQYISNHFSFNLFGGNNGGVEGMEIGAFVNITQNDVLGFQVAGISNYVKGHATALQVAGIINYSTQNFEGFQVAGLSNFSPDTLLGLQASGIYNSCKHLTGAQITGISSYGKSIVGMQVAGISNIADSLVGFQVAGISNTANSIEGLQVSGLINSTKHLKGAQLGFINIADSVHEGAPIGFFSYSKSGYTALDFSYSELLPLTFSFKTGVDAFYNIFTGSSNFDKQQHLWSFGYGLGTRVKLGKVSLLEFEAIASHLSKNDFEDELNALARVNLNLAFRLGKFTEIYFGPSLNGYLTQVYNTDSESYGYDIAPDHFYSEVFYDFDKPTYMQLWVGAQIGMKLKF